MSLSLGEGWLILTTPIGQFVRPMMLYIEKLQLFAADFWSVVGKF